MSTALVTGATGFVGRHLARRLAAERWSVRLLIRDVARLDPVLASCCECLQADLADREALRRAVHDVNVVFHCAADVRTWGSEAEYMAANVDGVRNLLRALSSENPPLTRLVHLSTVDVYGFPRQPCDESGPVQRSGFGYGDSKLLGEALVHECIDKHRLPCTILRPTNVMGPGSPFVRRIGEAMRAGLMLTIDRGACNAGVLDVENLVDTMLWAASADVALGRTYNVRDDCDVTWAQVVEHFRRGLGRGRVVDLSFSTADALARIMEGLGRTLAPSKEPLLHRLIVRIFGRTCGHSTARLRKDGGLYRRVTHGESMQRSIDWFKTLPCPE